MSLPVYRAVTLLPAIALFALPLVSFAAVQASLIVRLLIAALLVVSAVRPHAALLVCVGLVPLGTPLAALLGSSLGLAEPIVLSFLAGWLIRESAGTTVHARDHAALITPALLLASTAAASCVAQLAALSSSTGGPAAALGRAVAFLGLRYFTDPGRSPALAASALLVQGVGLYVAVVILCRRDFSLAPRIARMTIACGAGAAVLNLSQVLETAMARGTSLAALVATPAMMRVSWVFPDVNTAGSYFAMVLLMSAALVVQRRLHVGWVATSCFAFAGLWLAGSRAAIIAVPVAGTLLMLGRRFAHRRSWVGPAIVSMLVLSVVGWVVVQMSESRTGAISGSIDVRVELARTGLRMLARDPLLGVGVGRYYTLSSDYASPGLRLIYPHENAHNNFLQILVELGIPGLALFLWILAAVARQTTRPMLLGEVNPMLLGSAGGLIAFLLTCLAGHPLLVQQVAYAFWMVLGLTAGLVPASAPAPLAPRVAQRRPWRLGVTAVVAFAIFVSIPVRVRQMISESTIERPPAGLSDWQTDAKGTSFRWMDARAEFQVLVSARVVTLPLRLDPNGSVESSAVEVYVDDQFLARVDLIRGVWREFRFVAPPAPPHVHFRRIALHASGPTPPPRIQVGRPILTRPLS